MRASGVMVYSATITVVISSTTCTSAMAIAAIEFELSQAYVAIKIEELNDALGAPVGSSMANPAVTVRSFRQHATSVQEHLRRVSRISISGV